MSRSVVYLIALAAVIAVVCVTGVRAADEGDKDHYPIAWMKVDIKPIVDNDRLFKKYKDCLLTDKPVGCPRDVTEFKKVIPEVIETLCAKCLPGHIEKFKEAIEYICKTRRADYDEVRNSRDPGGKVQAKFEEKFGKVNC